jgi:hypothetical protein
MELVPPNKALAEQGLTDGAFWRAYATVVVFGNFGLFGGLWGGT